MRSTGDARKDYLIATHMAKPGYRGKIDAFCIHCLFDSEGGGGVGGSRSPLVLPRIAPCFRRGLNLMLPYQMTIKIDSSAASGAFPRHPQTTGVSI